MPNADGQKGEPKSLMCIDRDIGGLPTQIAAVRSGGSQLKGHTSTHTHSDRDRKDNNGFGRRSAASVAASLRFSWTETQGAERAGRPVNNSMNAITAPRFQAGGDRALPRQRLETRSN